MWLSDYAGSQTKLSKILLNGNNVCMVSDFNDFVRSSLKRIFERFAVQARRVFV